MPYPPPRTGDHPVSGAVQSWYDDLAQAMTPLDAMGAASLVVDATSGSILGSTTATRVLLGGRTPTRIEDLTDAGLIAKPDLARLRSWVLDRRRVDRRDRPEVETTHSLTDRLRVHRPDRSVVAIEVSLVYHRRPRLRAEAVTISLQPLDDDAVEPAADQVLPRELWTLYDAEMRVVATDPRLAELGIDPRSQLAMPAATLSHPEDLPGVLEPVIDVLTGRTRSAEVRLRVAVADGGWMTGVFELRPLVSAGAPLFAGVFRFDRTGRRAIPNGVLSPRQHVVVSALFDGRRVKEIAATEHVSERTVRNQLAAVYRKLDVSGQGDLLASYLRPSEAGHHPSRR
jgi:DNA-binding CsgD family transcriptional regulator